MSLDQLRFLLMEYEKIKDEQIHRIGFRDAMIHVHLVAVGAAAGWGLSHPDQIKSLLIIPWVCFILGWTYIVKDEKISAIGRYIRHELDSRCRGSLPGSDALIFEWERVHRIDEHRVGRKIWQLVVDLTAFVLAGFAALVAYLVYRPPTDRTGWPVLILMGIEGLMLIALGSQFLIYTDFGSGAERPSGAGRANGPEALPAAREEIGRPSA